MLSPNPAWAWEFHQQATPIAMRKIRNPAILTGGGSCQLSRERALDRNSKQGLLAENLAWQQD
jgi:hypothetical protein